jgi:hypothetical protein
MIGGICPKHGGCCSVALHVYDEATEHNHDSNDVIGMLPSNKNKTISQIRSGFNPIRDVAKSALDVLNDNDNGK